MFRIAGPLILMLGLLVAWILIREERVAENTGAVVPVTSYLGDESSPSFSPDGNQVAFQWRRPGQDHANIYIKLVGASEPVPLTTGPRDDYCPSWSPAGRSIAFFRRLSQTESGLFMVPAIGGPERKLTEVEPPPYASCAGWHPAGRSLIVSDKTASSESYDLFSVSIETGKKQRLTSSPQKFGVDRDPSVSPGGEAPTFARRSAGNSNLYLLELSGGLPKGAPKQITFEAYPTLEPVWKPNGRAIVFCSGSPHRPNLYQLALSRPGWRPGRPQRLLVAGEGVRKPTISRQGRLAYSKLTIDANIWRLELNGEGASRSDASRVIASTRLDHTPQYSPDGRRIAFASDRSGSHEIWVSSSDGSGAVQLSSFGGPYYTSDPKWSPDGSLVAFTSNIGGHESAYVVSLQGRSPERIPLEGLDSWSQDGKWVYFTSKRSGDYQVWRASWPYSEHSGEPVQITRKGGIDGHESPDAQFVYYLKDRKESTSLWRVPARGGEESQVLDSICCKNFAVVDRGIYFIPGWHGEATSSVLFLAFATGKVTVVASMTGLPAYGMSLSPDHRSLLYSQYETHDSDLFLVEHIQ